MFDFHFFYVGHGLSCVSWFNYFCLPIFYLGILFNYTNMKKWIICKKKLFIPNMGTEQVYVLKVMCAHRVGMRFLYPQYKTCIYVIEKLIYQNNKIMVMTPDTKHVHETCIRVILLDLGSKSCLFCKKLKTTVGIF